MEFLGPSPESRWSGILARGLFTIKPRGGLSIAEDYGGQANHSWSRWIDRLKNVCWNKCCLAKHQRNMNTVINGHTSVRLADQWQRSRVRIRWSGKKNVRSMCRKMSESAHFIKHARMGTHTCVPLTYGPRLNYCWDADSTKEPGACLFENTKLSLGSIAGSCSIRPPAVCPTSGMWMQKRCNVRDFKLENTRLWTITKKSSRPVKSR